MEGSRVTWLGFAEFLGLYKPGVSPKISDLLSKLGQSVGHHPTRSPIRLMIPVGPSIMVPIFSSLVLVWLRVTLPVIQVKKLTVLLVHATQCFTPLFRQTARKLGHNNLHQREGLPSTVYKELSHFLTEWDNCVFRR